MILIRPYINSNFYCFSCVLEVESRNVGGSRLCRLPAFRIIKI